MFKKHLLLLLLLALVAPWAANAQGILTVHDGTTTNSYVPIEGYWTDAYNKCEIVYPASELNAMASGTITSLKFYSSNSNVSWGNASFQVFLTEVEGTTISTFAGPGTVVYQGALSVSSSNEMNVEFTTPYVYNGGNLLIGVYETTTGSFSSCPWYGETVNGASVQGHSSSSLASISPTQRNFLPKTTFGYVPAGGIFVAAPSNLTVTLTPGDGTVASLAWTENGTADQWEICLNDNETNLINAYINPYPLTSLTPETAYTAKVRAVTADGHSAWSNTITFTPTNAYNITVNDGTTTDYKVPIYGSWVDNKSYSQFIIPADDLTTMQWGIINKLTFYGTNTGSHPNWDDAQFEVYMTETTETTLSALADWNTMDKVMNAAHLQISDGQMLVVLDAPFQYLNGNLMIGIKQTVSGSYSACSWNGVSATGASMGGYGNSISQQNFLPKTTFEFLPGETPDCLPVSGLTIGAETYNSAELHWTPGSDETHWKLQYRIDGANEWNTVDVAESDLVQGNYTLGDLIANTTYNWQVAAWCGYPDDEPISIYTSGSNIVTPCELVTITEEDSYFEDFNDYEGTDYSNNGVMPFCWDVYGSYSSAVLPHVYGTDYYYSYNYCYTNCLVMPGNSGYTYAALPEFSNALNTLMVNFKWAVYSTNSNAYLSLGYIADEDVNFNTFTEILRYPSNSISSGTAVQVDPIYLNELPATASRLAFRWYSSYSSNIYMCQIDDLEVAVMPDCMPSTDLFVSGQPGKHTATFGWTPIDATQTAWQIGLSLTNSSDDISIIADVDDPEGSEVTGLTPSTTYYAWVRGDCTASDDGYSTWSIEYTTFTTEIACPVPNQLMVAEEDITSTSAILTWVAGGEETIWNIQLAEYDDATETWSDYELIAQDYDDNSYDIENLTQATTYRVQVQAMCGGDYGVSDWSEYAEFTTVATCETPLDFHATNETGYGADIHWVGWSDSYQVEYRETSLLLEEGFEGYTNNTFPSDWSIVNGSPYVTSSYHNTGNNSLRFTGSYNNIVAMPQFGTETNLLKISFYMMAENSSYNGNFEVGYITDVNDASSFVAVSEAYHYSNYTSFTLISDISMTEAPAGARIAFRHTPNSNNYWWYIDDIIVEKIESDPWIVADDNVTDLTYTFDQLDELTTYETRVKGVCGNDESQYSNVVSFTTECRIFSVTQETPYIYDFEDALRWNCWTPISGTSRDGNTYLNNTPGGRFYLLFSGYTSNLVALPEFEQDINGLMVTFWTRPESGNENCGTFDVGYMTDLWDAESFVAVSTYNVTDWNSIEYVQKAETFTNAPAGSFIAFRHNPVNSSYYWYVDDVMVSLPDKVFTGAVSNDWHTAANWTPEGEPDIEDDVIIIADAVVSNEAEANWIVLGGNVNLDITGVATANNIAQGNSTITIEDGGQLIHNTPGIVASVKKNITGYTGATDHYYLIANPLTTPVTPDAETNMLLSGNYDLYGWDVTDTLEWTNYKDTLDGGFMLNEYHNGYLYANDDDTELNFTGTIMPSNNNVNIWAYYISGYEFSGWNLLGNPFVCNAYFVNSYNEALPFYRMNAAGDGLEAVETGIVAPTEGIFYAFVLATGYGRNVYFTRTAPSNQYGKLNMMVSQGRGTKDNAILRFGKGEQLVKMSFHQNCTKVYFPMDGKDYAVANAQGNVGEMPVNFKAETNGSYTLNFTDEEVTFSYLHLIDNLTGKDVDLLVNPSYSFDAKTTDYASRFKLVFATGSSVYGDSFGFINGMGNLCIFGIEGKATLQVIDMLGRVLNSETFSGSYEKKLDVAPDVYLLRLINGDNVKVQKMVVK